MSFSSYLITSNTRAEIEKICVQNPQHFSSSLANIAVNKVFTNVAEAVSVAKIVLAYDVKQGVQAFAAIAECIAHKDHARAVDIVTRALHICKSLQFENAMVLTAYRNIVVLQGKSRL